MNATAQRADSIAVVGMGCRLPRDVDSPNAMWRLLVEAHDAVTEPPPGRTEGTEEPADTGEPTPRWGGYLRDVSGFDADFFGVSGREADVLDPQHRLLLEVAWEALEHAGIPPDRLAGTPTGLFCGLSYSDYMESLAGQPRELEGSILTNGHCVAAGRISYLLGLHGPCVALDTACSSSLVATHLACQALRDQECDLALAGGVSLILGARTTRSFTRMGMLSPTGRCRTFDAAADGFVRSEGCGMVVLKRLPDALRDGDRVLAVLRGSAVNQDGRSDGLAAPSPAAQQALFRQALERAGTDPREVGLIETHGTGTPVGDPIEFSSLAAVYGVGQGRCALGSVKTNVGHLEPAAGVIGLIKAVQCVRHGLIPPNLHFSRWNPAITADGTRLFVPTELNPWPVRTAPRLAAVSSFGFSGTNAHMILEQPPATVRRPPAVTALKVPAQATAGHRSRVPVQRTPPPEVFLVSAGSANALPAAAERLALWLEHDGADVPLHDIAHTLALRHSLGRGRLGVVAPTHHDLVRALRSFKAGRAHPGLTQGEVGAGISRRPVWVFSGQGSQRQGMGRGLYQHEPAFAEALAEVDTLITAEAGFSVLEAIHNREQVTGCGWVQPALFALQIALAATWRAHGVEPAAVIGHSMGEVAAAVTAGALTLADGVRVICRRSALLARIAGSGAMATVALSPATVERELTAASAAGTVSVAVLAAPDSTVIAGNAKTVRRLVTTWQARGITAHLIAVDVASHCAQVDPLLADLGTALANLSPRQPAIPFYSTVLDDPHETPLFDAAYWCANLRNPVRFTAAVAAAAAARHQVYIELSPQPVVTHSLAKSLANRLHSPVIVPTLRRDEDEPTTFRTQLAALHCAGVGVDWSRLYADGHLADVPPLTFDRRPHWTQTAPALRATRRPGAQESALPGTHTEIPGSESRHYWRADTGTDAVPWLADHCVHGGPVLPGAAYCALALTTARDTFRAAPHEVEATDIHFRELMHLAANTHIGTTVTQTAPDRADCEIFSRGQDGTWARHATAVLRRTSTTPQPTAASVPELEARHPVILNSDALYTSLRTRGLEHGPAFQGIIDLRGSSQGDSFWARVTLPAATRTGHHALIIHPVLLDLCAQLVVAGLILEPGHGLILPVHVGRIRIAGNPETAAYAHAQIDHTAADGVVGNVLLLDQAGNPVATVEGLRFIRHGTSRKTVDRWFLETSWRPRPPTAARPADPGTWIVLGESDGSAEVLADTLSAAGATTRALNIPVGDDSLDQLKDSLTTSWALPAPPPRAVVLLCEPPTPGQDTRTTALRRTRRLLAVAQTATAHAEPPRVYAVTRAAHSPEPGRGTDPAQGALRGLVRVLTHEHPELRATLIDTDPGDADLHGVARELLADAPEDEVALRGTARHIALLSYTPLSDGERTTAMTRTVRYGSEDRFQLRVGRMGDLNTLEFALSHRRPPGPGEVELRVRAAGVNFRDVLTAMGMLSTDEDAGYRIGFECTGEVTAVGPGVEHVRVGDAVLAADLRGGAFASFATVPADAVAPIPAGVDPDAAAGLPVAFLTAWYALHHIARLSAGERVLIHSATGGTGLAAVAVAARLGAEVFATAGTEEKRRYLRGMGIAHVMDSRSLDFAEQTRAATAGEGVDVVLNSLSGQAIRAGLETLRPFGRFVELGVRDIISDARLGLAPLRHNITMSTVDLIELQTSRPQTFATVMREVLEELGRGTFAPLPCRVYPISQSADALRQMAGARHTGKLVLTVPNTGNTTAVLQRPPSPVRADGAYLITGGLRGVGLATASWLARQGASHLVLNGRTAPSPTTEQVLAHLRQAGIRVSVVLGDIAEPGTADRLVAAATADGLPLRGVIHAAMVLHDAAITNITDAQLERVWHPKVTGAWRLHEATSHLALDWFVLYSSIASLLGNPGQGAYAAANAWLDAFATWRTGCGLRTLAVNWGPWGETGVATGFAARGYQTIPTAEGLQALATLLTHDRVHTGVIPGPPATWIPPAGRHSSLFGLLSPDGQNREDQSAVGRDVLTELRSAEPGLARRTALEDYLAEHIRTVLRLGSTTLDPQTPLKALGFDSLLRIELRTRLESGLATRLSNDFVWQHPTLAALATGLAEHLGLDLDLDGDGSKPSSAPARPTRTGRPSRRDGTPRKQPD